MLKFSVSNSKLHELAHYLDFVYREVVAFDLPAGYTCKMARDCKAHSNRKTGKITDSKDMKFRCYAASMEARSPAARRMHWHNFDALKSLSFDEIVDLINKSLPVGIKVMRIHASGDFFSKDYFYAWYEIARQHPDIMFFGYTKFLEYVHFTNMMKLANFKLVYSFGGLCDNQVTCEPSSVVVNTPADAKSLPVACVNHPADDYDYILAGVSFAIVMHGTQPAKGG